ncbi:hypothetical protein V8C37DRAFT_38557 [Trichoderma ceciliae]
MASPELAITKATLSATLFRADPISLNRAAVDAFFSLLDIAIIQCSRQNVQKCKAWIVENIVPSTARCTALGKFWAVLSKNLAVENDGKRPSTKRRRLHLLNIVNDVLFHVVVRQSNRKLGEAWAGILPALVGNAAAFDNCPKHKTKLNGLVDLWEEKAYFSPELVTHLRTALANGSAEMTAVNLELSESSLKLAKDAPYILPSFHGDASIPWYDLPAGTWLPHITPNSSRPMIPDQVCPIQLATGPADKRVVDAVKMLLKDADYIYSQDIEPSDDLQTGFSELGERIVLDEITGEVIGGESYYGWSRQFCERMRDRLRKSTKPSADRSRSVSNSQPRSRSRSLSHDLSRSSSPPSFKRPRLSSRSRSRSRQRGRSYSHSRSRSRSRNSRSRSHSRARGRDGNHSHGRDSRSRSPQGIYGSNERPDSRFRSLPRQYDDRPSQPSQPPHVPPVPFPPPPPPPNAMGFPFPPLPLPPMSLAGFTQQWTPGAAPPPPPPPPPYGASQDGWVPPPPNMMAHFMNMNQFPAGSIPPPPQPPQPPMHNNQYGRGNGGYRGRGRGGYGRGGYRGQY